MAKWNTPTDQPVVMLMKKTDEKMIPNWPDWIEDDGFITIYPEKYRIAPANHDMMPAPEGDLEE
jgi:ABC-type sulfate transport system substrate-binding protein